MKISSAMIPVQSVSEKLVSNMDQKKKPTIAIETNIESVAGVISYVEFGSTGAPVALAPLDANLYDRLGNITQKMTEQVNQFTMITKALALEAEPATQTTSLDIII